MADCCRPQAEDSRKGTQTSNNHHRHLILKLQLSTRTCPIKDGGVATFGWAVSAAAICRIIYDTIRDLCSGCDPFSVLRVWLLWTIVAEAIFQLA